MTPPNRIVEVEDEIARCRARVAVCSRKHQRTLMNAPAATRRKPSRAFREAVALELRAQALEAELRGDGQVIDDPDTGTWQFQPAEDVA